MQDQRYPLTEEGKRRRIRDMAWDAKRLPVPATSDVDPPTYGALLAYCEVLQLLGGYSGLTETMLATIREAQAKIKKEEESI